MILRKLLSEKGIPKKVADRILIILDDQVGADILRGERLKDFVGINTRHRHHGASIMMVTQAYKEFPKTIRTNWTSLIVFEIGNEKEVEAIYEEYQMALTKKQWFEVYRYCIKDPYAFMYLNIFFEKGKRIRKNFDEVINVVPDEEFDNCMVPSKIP